MVFVDTATPEGANSYYPNGIPEGIKNLKKEYVAKKEFLWTRNDVYFYNDKNYILPENVNYTHVFSIDRYPSWNGTCIPKFGDARAQIMVQGYFNHSLPFGLKPNEYSNELLMHCDRQKIFIKGILNQSFIKKNF